MGLGLAASDETPLAGQARGDPRLRTARARSELLPLRRQFARQRRAQSRLRPHLRVRQRLRRPRAGRARRADRERPPDRRGRVGRLPRAVLLAAPRSDDRHDGGRRHRAGGRRLGRGDDHARRPAGCCFRTNFREPRRDHGLLQPASARPDLGDPPSAQRDGEGDPRPGAVSHRAWPAAAGRLSRPGTHA